MPPELSAVPEPSRSRAVLIGASRYAHGDFPDLPGVVGNLTGLAAFLTSPRGWNLRPEHCSVIGDPEGPDPVMRELGAAAGEAEDTLLVYFAGHGRLDRTADGTGEGLCWALGGSSANDVYVTGVAYRQVRRLLTDSNVRRVVVVVDCCYSGWAGELLPAVPDDGDYAITGVYVLTACAANDLAMAPPGAERTAFTGTLLRVLENGVPEGPDLLDLGTVVDRLRAELPDGYPRPQCVATNTVMRLAFARNPASPAAGRAGADPGRLTVGCADPVANAGTRGRAGAGPGADPTADGIAGTDEATEGGTGTGNGPAPDVLPERRPARQVRAAPVDGPRSGRVGPLVDMPFSVPGNAACPTALPLDPQRWSGASSAGPASRVGPGEGHSVGRSATGDVRRSQRCCAADWIRSSEESTASWAKVVAKSSVRNRFASFESWRIVRRRMPQSSFLTEAGSEGLVRSSRKTFWTIASSRIRVAAT